MPLIYLSGAWVAGILVASILVGSGFTPHFALIFTALAPLILLFFLRKHRKSLVLIGLCLTVFFGGMFRSPPASVTGLQSFNGTTVEIQGIVTDDPEIRDKVTHLRLRATAIKPDQEWQEVTGTALLFAPRYPVYSYGDELVVRGKLETPPQIEGFNYKDYLAHEGIYSTMLHPKIEIRERGKGSKLLAGIYSLRNRLAQILAQALPEPQAALAQGIVLGIRSNIPSWLTDEFSRTGTAHVLAISGVNLTIVVGILLSLGLRLWGRRHYLYVWLALGTVWLYALLTGMNAPVARSAIMASLFLTAELLGRQRRALPALSFAAAIMVGISPNILGQASFQLSFLAMAGLILLTPPLQSGGRKAVAALLGENGKAISVTNMLIDSFSVTLGAIIAVWPVIAYYFGIISLAGPVATFLAMPALPAIIVTGVITGGLGLIALPLAQVAGWLAWLFLIDSFSVTLGAIIAVWPVIAYYFGIISLAGPVATFLAMPALPAIIVTGIITGGLGLIALPLAHAMGWLSWLFLSYLLLVVQGFAALSVSVGESQTQISAIHVTTSTLLLWVYYPALALALYLISHKKILRETPRLVAALPRKWVIPPLLVLAILTSVAAVTMPDASLHVSFLDVGQGDAILIQTPAHQNILIDGGPSPQQLGLALGQKMPFWKRTIDLVVLTHPHADHVSGLVEVLNRYQVKQVLYPALDYQSPVYEEFLRLVREKNITYTLAQAGQQIKLGSEVAIEILHPTEPLLTGTESDIDNNSLVLRVMMNRVSFLLTADTGQEAELELISRRAYLTSTVLKVAHHGSEDASSPEFLAVVNPRLAVISVGENRFGHPSRAVRERLEQRVGPENIHRTDNHGTIEFITDGERLWVKRERQK